MKRKFLLYLKKTLNKLGYEIVYKIISPLDIGIPQNRNRIFILGFKNANHLKKFSWPNNKKKINKLNKILN